MTDVLPLEQRPISEMTFGLNKCVLNPALGKGKSETWKPSQEQEDEQAWVRNYLEALGCTVAGDIERLGCTGVAAVTKHDHTTAMSPPHDDWRDRMLADGTRLRLGLAGSGVGLPCFVPPTRYCLLHDTIGGLEKRQVQHHAEFVDLISRPLTPEEEAKVAAMNRASTMKSVGELNDFIAGKTEVDEESEEAPEIPSDGAAFVRLGEQMWKCSEHTETVWSCRYCLAQAIVEGPLEPRFAYGPAAAALVGGNKLFGADAAELVQEICRAQAANQDKLYIYACVTTFTRKLSRD